MPLVVALVPHTGEEMFICGREDILNLAAIFFIPAIRFNICFGDFCFLYLGGKILSKHNRPVAVLLTADIPHQTYRVIYVKHIHRGVGAAAHQRCEITRITQQHKRESPKAQLQEIPPVFIGNTQAYIDQYPNQ